MILSQDASLNRYPATNPVFKLILSVENRFRSGTEKVSKQTQYFVEGGLVSVSKQTQSLAEGGLVSILNKLRIFLKVAWLEIANSFSSWSSSIRSSANSKL